MVQLSDVQLRITGKLITKDHSEEYDVLFIEGDDEPLAKRLDRIHYRYVSVCYWITEVAMTRSQVLEAHIKTVLGQAEARYSAVYSDVTGYLWTDQDLKIGGHDLLQELTSHVGKFVTLEIVIHSKPPAPELGYKAV